MGGAVRKVKKIFSAPSPAPPPPPPPAPTPTVVAATAKSSKSVAKKAYLGGTRGTSGRKSTMITGGTGVEDEAEILRKTLLGA